MSETKRPAKCALEFKLQAVRRVKGGQVPSQPVAPTSAPATWKLLDELDDSGCLRRSAAPRQDISQ